ncbi:MAG: type II/IV secretion system protein [Phycisphaeraceae bacterium]|nr:type II/IV secretion system protein [Phycisphaeraceae bacterium]
MSTAPTSMPSAIDPLGKGNGAARTQTGRAGEENAGDVLTRPPAIDERAANLINAETAVRLRAVPFAFVGSAGPAQGAEGGVLRVAMVDGSDLGAADEISVLTGTAVERVAVLPTVFDLMLRSAFGATAAQMAARLGGGTGEDAEEDRLANLEAVDADDVQRMAEQPTLINLVNLIILEAVRERASDIHVEPFERSLSVKYRIDGSLRPQTSPPKHLQAAITSRIKIMAGMNIAERYVPQDGHITLRFEGRKVDIRVSTVPTIYGESVVMRILDKEAMNLSLESVGLREADRRTIEKFIDLPHGMVLVTGPTGSGKTTTLYAALTKLYDPSLKIITIEDPVEYELAGVNQIPVNPDRGLTFAGGLRSILRQDPDVIMVGEIRDGETADIAVRAALTGHLIFSTLHTNDAVSAVGRLLDMDVEPFLVASVLEGIMAQRLGRRVCPGCRVKRPLEETLKHRLSAAERAMFADGMEWVGEGCEKCSNSGLKSRIGYFEIVNVTGPVRAAITEGRTSSRELLAAVGPGHISMRMDGVMKAAEGMTTLEEVFRATQDAEDL